MSRAIERVWLYAHIITDRAMSDGPLDVRAGTAWLNHRTERMGAKMTEVVESLEEQITEGAQVYLAFGPAPLTELVWVLAQHVPAPPTTVRDALVALTANGVLNLSGTTVSLPAGSGIRDTEEREQ